MKEKSREFLNLMLWSAEKLARPTFRNLTGSYEEWCYRNGLLRQAAVLEKQRFLESRFSEQMRIYRLTELGRLQALGGRDPEKRWVRNWDGLWRVILFDIPRARNICRTRLLRYFHQNAFGFLQNSVWITADPLDRERQALAGLKSEIQSVILLEGRPVSGESDAEIVAAAWNFQQINRRYASYLKIAELRPAGSLRNETSARNLQRWATAEQRAWLEAITPDPLLPQRILPADYLGQIAWRRRMDALEQASRQIRHFTGKK